MDGQFSSHGVETPCPLTPGMLPPCLVAFVYSPEFFFLFLFFNSFLFFLILKSLILTCVPQSSFSASVHAPATDLTEMHVLFTLVSELKH